MRFSGAAFAAIALLLFQSSTAFSQSRALDALTNSIFISALAEKEGLSAPMPTGFKIGESEDHGDVTITQYIPANETLQSYSVAIAVFKVNKPIPLSIEQYDQGIVAKMASYCNDPESKEISSGVEGVYPFSEWLIGCPINSRIQKPEYMVTKTIKGNYSFIAVNYTFESKPNDSMVAQALAYLKAVTYCHQKSDGSGCPTG